MQVNLHIKNGSMLKKANDLQYKSSELIPLSWMLFNSLAVHFSFSLWVWLKELWRETIRI